MKVSKQAKDMPISEVSGTPAFVIDGAEIFLSINQAFTVSFLTNKSIIHSSDSHDESWARLASPSIVM